MYKLNLVEPKPKPKKSGPVIPGPVGWWNVHVSHDIEEKTGATHGPYYGHIAELALSLPHSTSWKYYFSPAENPGAEEKRIQRERIRDSMSCAFWLFSSKYIKPSIRVDDLIKWLDCDQIEVKKSNLFQSFEIHWKG